MSLTKGHLHMRSSVLIWFWPILWRATVPGWYLQDFFIRPFYRNSFWGPFLPLWAWDDWLPLPLLLLTVPPLPSFGLAAMSDMILVTCPTLPASPPPTSSSPSLPAMGVPPLEASSPSYPWGCFCLSHSAMEEQPFRGHGRLFGIHIPFCFILQATDFSIYQITNGRQMGSYHTSWRGRIGSLRRPWKHR